MAKPESELRKRVCDFIAAIADGATVGRVADLIIQDCREAAKEAIANLDVDHIVTSQDDVVEAVDAALR